MKPLLSSVLMLVLAYPVAAGAQAGASDASRVNPDAQLIVEFTKRVDDYIAVRNKADNATPAPKPTADAGQIDAAQTALAAHLKSARASARQGDIFTPAISAHFKRLLRPETKDAGTKASIQADNPGAIPFKINAPYPDKEPRGTMPPNVLDALPKLPENQDLDYRFTGKHLILLDTRANMIIDYVPNALP